MNIDIQFIRNKERFPFRFIDFLNCLFLILPSMLILISFAMIRSYMINHLKGINELLTTALIIGIIGVALFVFIVIRLIHNLRFIKIVTGLNFNLNIELIDKVFAQLYDKQSIDKTHIDNGILYAHTSISLFSWGETNTAICNDKEILINSRPTGQPVTFFENRQNLKRIEKNIEIQTKLYYK